MKLYSRRMQIEQNFRDEKKSSLGIWTTVWCQPFIRVSHGIESDRNVSQYHYVVKQFQPGKQRDTL